jgi:hypothetical protein
MALKQEYRFRYKLAVARKQIKQFQQKLKFPPPLSA